MSFDVTYEEFRLFSALEENVAGNLLLKSVMSKNRNLGDIRVIPNHGDHYIKQILDKSRFRKSKNPKSGPHSQLYAVGGDTERRTSSGIKTLERYDFRSKDWEFIGDIPHARRKFAVTAHDKEVWLAGGISGEGVTLNTVSVYNPQDGRWRHLSEEMIVGRSNFGLVELNSCLYAAGGLNGKEVLKSTEMLDAGRQWIRRDDMNSRRRDFGISVLNDDDMVAVGGHDGNCNLHTAETYSRWTKQWTLLPPRITSFKHSELFAVYLNDGLYHDGDDLESTIKRNWKRVQKLKLPVTTSSVAEVNGQVYLVGGRTLHREMNKRLRRVDLTRSEVSCLPGTMRHGRNRPGIAVVDPERMVYHTSPNSQNPDLFESAANSSPMEELD